MTIITIIIIGRQVKHKEYEGDISPSSEQMTKG